MKTLKAAILIFVLAPTLALAEEVPTTTPSAAPAPAPTAAPSASASASLSAAALEEKENAGGFSLGVELDHSLGTGTFVSPDLYASFGATLAVSPRYVFAVRNVKLAVSLALRGAWEYTLPDSENGRRFSPADTRLGFSAPSLIKNQFTGISITPSLGVLIPTTPESWQATLVTALSVGVQIARPIGKFNLALTSSGSRGFHLSAVSQVRSTPSNIPTSTSSGARDQLQTFAARKLASGADEPFVAYSNTNTAWSFNIGGNVSFQATDELSFIVGYTYSRSWKYQLSALGPDERLPTGAKYIGESDRTSAVFGANYQLTEHYGLSLSASTLQAPRSGAGGAVGYDRFPFWAIANAADNATAISLTFSAAY